MDSGIIEYLILRAAANWKNLIRQIVNRKVIFLLGAPGSGKTSFGKNMVSKWSGDKALLIPEVGGDLRRLSASTSEMFEVPFEFATLALEIANMSCITMEDYGNVPLIVDGGIVQSYAHLWQRRENINTRIQDMISELYVKQMAKWFECLPNAYFLLLEHRDRREYNEVFEGKIIGSIDFIQSKHKRIHYQSAIMSSDMVTHYLQSCDNIPSIDDLLDKIGKFVRLCNK